MNSFRIVSKILIFTILTYTASYVTTLILCIVFGWRFNTLWVVLLWVLVLKSFMQIGQELDTGTKGKKN